MRMSPSSLSVFRECPRCYWWTQVKKVARPRGIFPSLPGGMDRVLKSYVENALESGESDGLFHLDGVGKGSKIYERRDLVHKWQNWRSGLSCQVGEVLVTGAIDDLVVWPDGKVSPLDFKTRGAAPKDGQSEQYYGAQLDIYHLLLEQDAGLKCTGKGYLRYGWPKQVLAKTVEFDWQTVVLETDPERAVKLVQDAAEVLRMTEPPDWKASCEYCVYVEERKKQG